MRSTVPIMAYHCKLYAIENGLKLTNNADPAAAAPAKQYLLNELGELEAMKKAMGDVNKEEMQTAVENFVLSVFAATDKEERTCPTITKKNAVDFKRTGDFIAVLTCFGPLDAEWNDKKKYCTYKAGTIMKALKNGEQPPRGNPFAPPEEEAEIMKMREGEKEEEKKEEDIKPIGGGSIPPTGENMTFQDTRNMWEGGVGEPQQPNRL